MDAAAVLLIELEGLTEQVEEQVEQIREVCLACQCARVPRRQVRGGARPAVEGPQERLRRGGARESVLLRAGRRRAAHQDRADAYGISARWRRSTDCTISNIFHAGDGNMHPIILFDARKPGDLEKAQKAGEEILDYCIAVGGSITGEHGVGMEKMELMAQQFPAADAGHDRRVQVAVRSRVPLESRQGIADRTRLHGDPPAPANRGDGGVMQP